ncbi:MAG: glycoside hydrolase family 3 N-terminal domain-containing protein [Pseudobdellovibrionaceae bacterium]
MNFVNNYLLNPSYKLKQVINFLFLIYSVNANSRDMYSKKLSGEMNLGVDYKVCESIENKLGQLFFIFTDGQGANPPVCIHPEYIKAIQDLGIGGIRLDSNRRQAFDMSSAKRDIEKIHSLPGQPVFISADFGQVNKKDTFGLGTYSGFLGHADRVPEECVFKRAYLNAFLHSAENINVALGPTVDPSNRDKKLPTMWGLLSTERPERIAKLASPLIKDFDNFSVATVLKHFPYTPVFMDIHQQNENVPDSPEKVQENIKAFKILTKSKTSPDFVMTTHLYNSNIDNTIATLSPKWINILKNDIGFNGIIVTDGLRMMGAFNEADQKTILSHWQGSHAKNIDQDGIVAALAILAGHDMIFVDDSLPQTKKLFQELHAMACQNDKTGTLLRERINQSYTKITAYKSSHKERLLRDNKVSVDLATKAVQLYMEMDSNENNSCNDSKRFNDLKKQIETTKSDPVSKKAGLR